MIIKPMSIAVPSEGLLYLPRGQRITITGRENWIDDIEPAWEEVAISDNTTPNYAVSRYVRYGEYWDYETESYIGVSGYSFQISLSRFNAPIVPGTKTRLLVRQAVWNHTATHYAEAYYTSCSYSLITADFDSLNVSSVNLPAVGSTVQIGGNISDLAEERLRGQMAEFAVVPGTPYYGVLATASCPAMGGIIGERYVDGYSNALYILGAVTE